MLMRQMTELDWQPTDPRILCIAPKRARRQGVTAVMAMLYLVLFSSLAVGFYTATATQTVVTDNEKRGSMAQVAAESGMDFMRYQLAQAAIPYGTPQDQLFSVVGNALINQLEGTGNLGSGQVGVSGGYINIPANPNSYITLDNSGLSFRVTLESAGQKLRVKIVGRYAGLQVQRAVQMDYDQAQKASEIFDYGIASKGMVTTDGVARIRGATDPTKGSILSTSWTAPTPIQVNGQEVSGDLSISNPAANVTVGSGASVGGTANLTEIFAKHVHKGVEEPEFPTIDANVFKKYATSTYTSGALVDNMVIKANTNPTFAAGATLKGVIYVETPNIITFRGHTDLQGVLVVQNNPTGNLSTNILDFRGDITASGVGTLPESYGELRKLTGAVILAPNFHTKFSGNFGQIKGHVISAKHTFDGNATGTIYGSVVNLNDTQMLVKGSSAITIASTGTTDYPAGVFFSSRYYPLPDTYEEVRP
jgi:hypothetical protein